MFDRVNMPPECSAGLWNHSVLKTVLKSVLFSFTDQRISANFKIQRRIQTSINHLTWTILWKELTNWLQSLIIFVKGSIFDVWFDS